VQMDTSLLIDKIDKATTEMKLAKEPPYATRKLELSYGEMMLIWDALALRNAIRDIVK